MEGKSNPKLRRGREMREGLKGKGREKYSWIFARRRASSFRT
jgi:hypothetical protein